MYVNFISNLFQKYEKDNDTLILWTIVINYTIL